VEQFIKPPQWGVFGMARVNVLQLNLALDAADTKKG
jgi:potassium-transporting ATPase KdpC subunit